MAVANIVSVIWFTGSTHSSKILASYCLPFGASKKWIFGQFPLTQWRNIQGRQVRLIKMRQKQRKHCRKNIRPPRAWARVLWQESQIDVDDFWMINDSELTLYDKKALYTEYASSIGVQWVNDAPTLIRNWKSIAVACAKKTEREKKKPYSDHLKHKIPIDMHRIVLF